MALTVSTAAGSSPQIKHVGVDRFVDVSELGRREMVERGDDSAARHRGLHVGGHTAPRWNEGLELLVHAHERVGHRHDDLAGERVAVLLRRPGGGVPRRGDDDEFALGSTGVVAGRQAFGEFVATCSTRSSTVSIARYFDREPMTTSCPMLASRAARPLPAGPVPPSIPMRMATAWHAHPVLVNSLRTRVCKKFTRTDEADCPVSTGLGCPPWDCSTARRS